MTNNEAAKWIQLYIDLAKIDPLTGETAYLNNDDRKMIEAMEMAINALTAQPSSSCAHENVQDLQSTCNKLATDYISRQAVIDSVCKYCEYYYNENLIQTIKDLPSAQPKRKTGKWILVKEYIKIAAYKCSECGRSVWDDKGYDVVKDYPYCHCGADMRGEQDESEKL